LRRPLVLVVSNSQDIHVGLVTNELETRGHRFARFDTDRVPNDCDVLFEVSHHRTLTRFCVDDFLFSAEDVTAVWWRRPEEVIASSHLDQQAKTFVRNEWAAALQGAWRTIDGLWVNNPERLRFARYKIPQLLLARDLGFSIPDTCVSADPNIVRDFCRRHDYRVIAKLADAGPPRVAPPNLQYTVYTTQIAEADLGSDLAISAAPSIYQGYIEKDYELRVTVVSDRVFACRIDSQATENTKVDWRRYDLGNTPHVATALSPQARDRCLSITQRLGLVFAAIDLIVTPDGETVCLEINPNGQWAWIQELTGLPIAQALAEVLGRVYAP